MTRLALLALWVSAVGCTGGGPADDPTDASGDTDTGVIETGLYLETDTAIWLDTGLETDETDLHTDTGGVVVDPRCALPGWVPDCNGECFAEVLVGNGFCDRGGATPKAHFDCLQFQYDGGDCDLDTDVHTDTDPGCPAGQVPDCNGVCFSAFLATDGVCHDGTGPGGVDFDCEAFGFDGGACAHTDPPDTDVHTDTGADTDRIGQPCPQPDQVRDCNGRCYYAGWLGDEHCDDGTVHPYGRPDFACELHGWDHGDCPQP